MEELEKIFIEMLDHIDNHKESYNKPQWTNEAIVKTWLKANEHKLKLLGIADIVRELPEKHQYCQSISPTKCIHKGLCVHCS